MSYTKNDVKDTVNALFSRLADFSMVSKNLLNAKDIFEFELWFEKCVTIDKRTTLLFLRKNKGKINPMYIEEVKHRFAEEI